VSAVQSPSRTHRILNYKYPITTQTLTVHPLLSHRLPMKFTFRLLDAPLLRTSDDFLGLVDLADADASLGAYKAASK
jgi:hypothetical protein